VDLHLFYLLVYLFFFFSPLCLLLDLHRFYFQVSFFQIFLRSLKNWCAHSLVRNLAWIFVDFRLEGRHWRRLWDLVCLTLQLLYLHYIFWPLFKQWLCTIFDFLGQRTFSNNFRINLSKKFCKGAVFLSLVNNFLQNCERGLSWFLLKRLNWSLCRILLLQIWTTRLFYRQPRWYASLDCCFSFNIRFLGSWSFWVVFCAARNSWLINSLCRLGFGLDGHIWLLTCF